MTAHLWYKPEEWRVEGEESPIVKMENHQWVWRTNSHTGLLWKFILRGKKKPETVRERWFKHHSNTKFYTYTL